ncbi:hypothetical protein ALC60_07323, partial [Trachymyrmex zeteki]
AVNFLAALVLYTVQGNQVEIVDHCSLWGFDSAVDRYTSSYNGAGVSAPGLESGSQRSLFVGPYLHSGIHGLGNTAPLTAVGWSKGNELACPPGR